MDRAAVFADIIGARRSVRAYRPEPVSRDILNSVFQLAQRAPSNCNTQPWTVAVVSGEKLDVLREQLPEAFVKGQLSMDFPYDGRYDGVYKDRQYGAARALYDAAGIERSDRPARDALMLQNFRFFDAPHCAFLFLPEPFGLREAADLGMYAQNLMLSLAAHGLGSVPQTALGFFADPVRAVLEIGPEQKLMFGISFGYEDTSNPLNRAWTDRAELQDAVRFYE